MIEHVPENLDPQEVSKEEKRRLAKEAKKLADGLKKFKYMLNYSFVQAAKVMWQIKEEKVYKHLGYETFTEFLADPEYGMPKATAFLYLYVYKYFIIDRKIDETEIMDIEISRLRVLPALLRKGGDVGEWLTKARTLGKGDFFAEVDEAKGRKPLDILPASPDEDEIDVSNTPYISLVKQSPCCVCETRPVDAHHFPQTKGAGAGSDRAIPLCRGCHIAFHQNPKDFLWVNRKKIFGWFYDLIEELISALKEGASYAAQDIPEEPNEGI